MSGTLYILRFEEFPNTYRVGKTTNMQQTLDEMDVPLTVEVMAEYENLGHILPAVHKHLDQYRVTTGDSREWFRCPLMHIEMCVDCVRQAENHRACR